jgi:hypothetical protein
MLKSFQSAPPPSVLAAEYELRLSSECPFSQEDKSSNPVHWVITVVFILNQLPPIGVKASTSATLRHPVGHPFR